MRKTTNEQRSSKATLPSGKPTDTFEDSPVGYFIAISALLLVFGNLLPDVRPNLSLATLALPVVFLVLVVQSLGPNSRYRKTIGITLLLFAALWLCIKMAPAPFTSYGSEKVDKLMSSTLITAAAGSAIAIPRETRLLARTWIALGVVLAAATVVSGQGIIQGRQAAFDSNPIWLARCLGLASLCALWLLLRRHVPRVVGLAAFGIIIAASLLTGSRGPVLGVVAGATILLTMHVPGTYFSRLISTAAIGFTAWVAMLTVPALAATRLGQTLGAGLDTTFGTTSAGRGRTELWSSALKLAPSHPFGIGPGNWAPTVHEPVLLWPHNIFVEATAELGWAAGATLATCTALVLVTLIRRARKDPSLSLVAALLACETVSVCFSGDINARTYFFLLIMGSAAILSTARPKQAPTARAYGRPGLHQPGTRLNRHARETRSF